MNVTPTRIEKLQSVHACVCVCVCVCEGGGWQGEGKEGC
jgi:hypothetical protein